MDTEKGWILTFTGGRVTETGVWNVKERGARNDSQCPDLGAEVGGESKAGAREEETRLVGGGEPVPGMLTLRCPGPRSGRIGFLLTL